MPIAFIAHSKQLAAWGGDVGLGKNIFLLAVADDADSAAAFLAGKPCGGEDWTLVKKEDVAAEAEEAALQDKLAVKEKRVDPNLYPRLRGFQGLYKVKLENVENHIMVKKALEGDAPKIVKAKPVDIAGYLLLNALK